MKNNNNKSHIINSKSDVLFDFVQYAILIFGLLIVTYPLYFVIIASVSEPTLVNAGKVWLYPKGFSMKGYSYVFRDVRMVTGYINTILYSIGFTLVSLFLTILAAYPLSNHSLVGRRFFNFLLIFPMYFGGGLIPTYIIVTKLNMVDNPFTLCILGALSTFNVIITRTFFETGIPKELGESAEIDGCNQAQTFLRIVLPLSKPIIAVIALYSFVGQWNSYFNAMIYLNNMKLFPLQLVLREILLQSQSLQDSKVIASITDITAAAEQQKLADIIKYCVITVSSAPLLCIFPFFQRYFAQGMMIGAVKG